LSSDQPGADALLRLIEAGHASARLLTDPQIAEQLKSVLGESATGRMEPLVAHLPPHRDEVDRLIAERCATFAPTESASDRGRAVFKQHCAACHQLGGEGKKVGPQLDGIGARGAARLFEDILDPNRNVDAAFRTTAIVTMDGRLITGLVQRREGAVLVLADSKGESIAIPEGEIDEQALSNISLMPSNFHEVIPPQDLAELVAELLRQTTPPATAAE
jgi:putative heme-binding domain-containing protein